MYKEGRESFMFTKQIYIFTGAEISNLPYSEAESGIGYLKSYLIQNPFAYPYDRKAPIRVKDKNVVDSDVDFRLSLSSFSEAKKWSTSQGEEGEINRKAFQGTLQREILIPIHACDDGEEITLTITNDDDQEHKYTFVAQRSTEYPIQSLVFLDYNGGTCDTNSDIFLYLSNNQQYLDTVTKPGYKFKGWSVNGNLLPQENGKSIFKKSDLKLHSKNECPWTDKSCIYNENTKKNPGYYTNYLYYQTAKAVFEIDDVKGNEIELSQSSIIYGSTINAQISGANNENVDWFIDRILQKEHGNSIEIKNANVGTHTLSYILSDGREGSVDFVVTKIQATLNYDKTLTYNAQNQHPLITINELNPQEYEVKFSNSIDVGTYSFSIDIKNNNYEVDQQSLSYEIKKKKLEIKTFEDTEVYNANFQYKKIKPTLLGVVSPDIDESIYTVTLSSYIPGPTTYTLFPF